MQAGPDVHVRKLLASHRVLAQAEVLREGLLILGWVALWRPVEWVLFDTWEHRQRRSALKRLATAEVRLVEG